jgi:hypothetical protein
LALLTIASAQQQSGDLAAYARQQKKAKPAASTPGKVFDNDNLPKTEHISVVGSESPEKQADNSDAPSAKADTASKSPADDAKAKADSTSAKPQDDKAAEIQPGQNPEDRKQAYDDWQTKIKEQKQAVDLAQRELDVAQREYRLRAAVVANDVGYRLRNAAQWDKEEKQYKEQIAAKQKAYDEAKQKLDSLQEDARKAGAPTKVRE